jgi:hypothetical protein
LVDAYQHNALFGAMLVLYIAGQAIGCLLLAIALWRRRAVPRWAAVAVGAFPIIGVAFAPAGAALAVAGFGACALTLRRTALEPSPTGTSATLIPART